MAKIRIVGDSSGYVEIAAPNAAGNNTLELPSGNTRLVGSDSAGNVSVSGIVTAATFSGNVNSTSGVTTVTTLNATSIVGVTTAGITTAYIGSVNDGPISGARNRIINGDCRVDQRYAGASAQATDGGYFIDRWSTILNAGNFSVQGNAGNVTPPVGFTSYFGATVTTPAGTTPPGGTSGIRYKVEGYNISDFAWGTSDAKTVTMSFWARSTGLTYPANFGGAIWNSAQTFSYPFLYTIPSSGTWTYITITIPGSTQGTWLNTTGVGIGIDFSMGTTTNTLGTPGSWTSGYKQGATGQVQPLNTNGSTLYLTGLQLEVGDRATPFERRSFGQELALCQRYCHKWGANGDGTNLYSRFPMGIWGSTTQITVPFSHPVSMRTVTKTVSSNTSAVNVYSQGLTFNSGVTFGVNTDANTLDTTFVNVGGLSGGTGNALAAARFLGDGNAYILFTTEL